MVGMGSEETHARIVAKAEAQLDRSLHPNTRTALTNYGHLPGCYAFLVDDVCVYIGRASELSSRPLTSARKRIGTIDAEIVLMPTASKADSYIQEMALIIHYKPKLNIAVCPKDELTFKVPFPKPTYRGQLYDDCETD